MGSLQQALICPCCCAPHTLPGVFLRSGLFLQLQPMACPPLPAVSPSMFLAQWAVPFTPHLTPVLHWHTASPLLTSDTSNIAPHQKNSPWWASSSSSRLGPTAPILLEKLLKPPSISGNRGMLGNWQVLAEEEQANVEIVLPSAHSLLWPPSFAEKSYMMV